jgi:hypothetical protein
MAIELDLNEKGQGTGRFFEDASIEMDPDSGTIIMDSYASAPKIFPTVQLVVKKAKKKGGDLAGGQAGFLTRRSGATSLFPRNS